MSKRLFTQVQYDLNGLMNAVRMGQIGLPDIQREFDRLYDPNHPVRNNLETLDSVEVVRTIRRSLRFEG